jgi:broad specificity phosphatase PhoE
MPIHIIVVRHGERLDEADRQEWRRIRTQETAHDPPLTEAGWNQAKLAGMDVASKLQAVESRITIYSSPTARTLSTASAIRTCLADKVDVVVPVYSLNCCAAAQTYGVATAFPKNEPSTAVMRGTPLACWPPLGDPHTTDSRQSSGGGFVEAVKELAATHNDGDVLVLVSHREGIWQILRHAGGKMKSGYCNTSFFAYELNSRKFTGWDGSVDAGQRTRPAAQPSAPSMGVAAAADPAERRSADAPDMVAEAHTLEAVLARASGKVVIHRGGRGNATSTSLWRTPGVRGIWSDGGAVPDNEVVELLSQPVSSEGKEGDFVLVRRASGHEGWTKVHNVRL